MSAKTLELKISLQDGMSAEIKGDKVIITIDTEKTKRDLWTAQMDFWLSVKGVHGNLYSGLMRIINNKLKFVKSR